MIEKGTDQDAVVRTVTGLYEDWKQARKAKEQAWTDCLNNYLCHVDTSKYAGWPWRSKICDTMSQELADTIASALRNALFPFNEDYCMVSAVDPDDQDAMRWQERMNTYFKSQLAVSNFLEKIRPFLAQLAVIGNSACTTPWVHKTKTRRIRGKTGAKQELQEVTYDLFSFETLDTFDVVLDPNVILTESSLMIWRTSTTLATLKAMQAQYGYENLDRLESEHKRVATDESRSEKQQRATVFGMTYEASAPDEEVELLIAYGDFEIDGRIYENYKAVIGNREVLLCFQENPYWAGKPVFFGTYNSLWFTPFGRGPIEPVLGQQELINTFVNQKADILNLIIMGTFAYVEDGIIDPDTLFLRPMHGIPVADVNNIKPLHPNANVALTYQEIEMLRARGDKSSGASDYERGVFPGGRKTAFEAQVIKQGSSNRLNDSIKHIGESVIEPILNFYLGSLQQFKYGSGEVEDEALVQPYRVNYYGADTSAVRQFELQQYMAFLDIIGRSREFSMALNSVEFLDEMRRLLGIKNKSVVRTKEELAAEMARQEALAQAERFMRRPEAMASAEMEDAA